MTSSVQTDFDVIARVGRDRWNTNNHYHRLLLRQLPERCGLALDLGCGTGDFTALLAPRFESVVGIDFSHEMIERARVRLKGCGNVRLFEQDIRNFSLAPASFDLIVSIATFHHLSLREEIPRLKQALAPGGKLIILDLYRCRTLADFIVGGLAFPAKFLLDGVYNRHHRPTVEEMRAWQEHGKIDVYLPLAEVRAVAREHLPGAVIRRLLFWRYALIWQNE